MSHVFNDSLNYTPNIEAAIDYQPLIVTAETSINSVVSLMNEARLSNVTDLELAPIQQSRSSCVLVTQAEKLVGIFTERDIVRLVATGVEFDSLTIEQVMTPNVIALPKADFVNVFAALFLFRRFQIRHLPITGENGEIIGIVSPESLRRILRPANFLKLRRVQEVMTTPVLHTSVNTTVLELAKLMAEHQVSCIVITEETEFTLEHELSRPVGIITERDIVQLQTHQLDLATTIAQNVMSTPLFVLRPDDSLWTAHQEMQRCHVRRLVVSWNWGKELGLVTPSNMMRVFDPIEMYGAIEALQCTVEQLQSEKAQRQLESAIASDVDRHYSPPEDDLNRLLCAVRISLHNMANQPEMSPDLRQTQINSALAQLDQAQSLVQRNKFESGG